MNAPIVEFISKEMIKPSSPTPQHLKNFKLSALDQFAPPIYVSIIFFYEADESKGLIASNHAQISHHLKKSLSETLNSFYQLAGRIRDDTYIDCNDSGVEFVDARVHSRLADSVQESDAGVLKTYLPMDPVATGFGGVGDGPLLLVQLNRFDCGGIAVGMCVAHQAADGTSTVGFIHAWAATSRGETEKIPRFSFDLAKYFPTRDVPGGKIPSWKTVAPGENLCTKRFVFHKEKLAVLKLTALSQPGSTVNDPTRVELVSAFIWKHVFEFNSQKKDKIFFAFHAVNLRARTGPNQRFLENGFGNFVRAALVLPDGEGDGELHDLVRKFRDAIRSIDADVITEIQNGDKLFMKEYLNLLTMENLELYSFTSWCGFRVYDVDFGWGKPVWVCTPRWPAKNLVILLKSRNGEDVEAWVNMSEEMLEYLDAQIKLI